MKTTAFSFLIFLFGFAFLSAGCQNTPAPGNMTSFATGLDKPVSITHAGDSRLFVVEQTGIIRIIDAEGNVSPQPFLDIRDRVNYGGERGLLGLAFHPGYMTNGYFYVNYTGLDNHTRVSRFSVNGMDPEIADPDSELNLLIVNQPFTNHNGGDLAFGPDGYLYIALGDGGSAGDPGNRAQNPMEYLGKMLRIDVDQGLPYAIPESNPFLNVPGTLDEIWALGLRNPWRFSFDRLTGDLWIADVGQNAAEEINFQPAGSEGGENYGWRCYEGNLVYNSNGCGPASIYTFPVHTYPHGPECSVTGGYVFRGNTSSSFYGRYFFADYCSDMIWTLYNEGGEWIREDFGHFPGNNFSAFGENVSGQLFVAGLTSGTIYRVIEDVTGMADDDALASLRIIHIPSSGKIRIENDLGQLKLIRLALFDTRGIVHFNDNTRESFYEFDTGMLSSGMYFLRIVMEGKQRVQKLMILR